MQSDTNLIFDPLVFTAIKSGEYAIKTFIKAENIETIKHPITIKVAENISSEPQGDHIFLRDPAYHLYHIGHIDASELLLSSTGTVRGGGGNTSIEVNPTTTMTTIWEVNRLKLFDLFKL